MKTKAQSIAPNLANMAVLRATSVPGTVDTLVELAVGIDRESDPGLLIVNADDWGRDRQTTDRTRDCFHGGTISSVSAMAFMHDSERAAGLAQEWGIDAGLHLNFTTQFSGGGYPGRLLQHQQRVARYLQTSRLSQAVFHPGLTNSFKYVVATQFDEFTRLYGREPARIDGHHHMHLCANVLFGRLLPPGTAVRRNFSFEPGEKGWDNRLYRRIVDRLLVRRHRVTDYFFSLPPLQPPGRLQRIFALARKSVVELETHPVNLPEYQFLREGGFLRLSGDLPIARHFASRPNWGA